MILKSQEAKKLLKIEQNSFTNCLNKLSNNN